nr:hypothetical protein [Kribbella pittospori]
MRKRVADGWIEIVGGWRVEPDCNIPGSTSVSCPARSSGGLRTGRACWPTGSRTSTAPPAARSPATSSRRFSSCR